MSRCRFRRNLQTPRALQSSMALHERHDTFGYVISSWKIDFSMDFLRSQRFKNMQTFQMSLHKFPQEDILRRPLQRIGVVALTSRQIFTIRWSVGFLQPCRENLPSSAFFSAAWQTFCSTSTHKSTIPSQWERQGRSCPHFTRRLLNWIGRAPNAVSPLTTRNNS